MSGACARAADDASSAAQTILVDTPIGVKLGTRLAGGDRLGGPPRRPAARRELLHRGAADHHEQPAFVPQRARPAELGEHVLECPVVLGGAEQVAAGGRFGGEQRVWKGPQVLDAILAEPSLHFAQGVAVLLDVAVLIAQPGLPAGRRGAPPPPGPGGGGPPGTRGARPPPPPPRRGGGGRGVGAPPPPPPPGPP